MRRRRPRRGMRRPPPARNRPPSRRPNRQLNPKLQRELKRANHLMQIGEHLNAAQIFLNLGENAQDRGILIPASMLFLQSATAYFLANELQQSIEQSYKGLNLLAANHRWAAFSREGQRIVEAWQHGGYSKEAQELLSWLEEKTNISSKKENEIGADNQKYSSGVPSKCPYCGASLSLQQIKNTRQSATECKYCGSVVIKDQIE